LPTVGSPESQNFLQFSSNAILVSFNIDAGRACQPSAARKAKKIWRFRQMQFSSRLMFMLAGLANRRLPRNPNFFAVFVKCNFSSQFMFMLAGLANLRLPGKPNKCAIFRQM
jgi:hypothetical protein